MFKGSTRRRLLIGLAAAAMVVSACTSSGASTAPSSAAGKTFTKGHVLLADGKIKDVGEGPGASAPKDDAAVVVDASGMFITPGLIDTHSHMGVYPLPFTEVMHASVNDLLRHVAVPKI